ncbi:MAG: hypothetical protein ACRD9L_23565 [Bryobacteraceae bacterium]
MGAAQVIGCIAAMHLQRSLQTCKLDRREAIMTSIGCLGAVAVLFVWPFTLPHNQDEQTIRSMVKQAITRLFIATREMVVYK